LVLTTALAGAGGRGDGFQPRVPAGCAHIRSAREVRNSDRPGEVSLELGEGGALNLASSRSNNKKLRVRRFDTIAI